MKAQSHTVWLYSRQGFYLRMFATAYALTFVAGLFDPAPAPSATPLETAAFFAKMFFFWSAGYWLGRYRERDLFIDEAAQ